MHLRKIYTFSNLVTVLRTSLHVRLRGVEDILKEEYAEGRQLLRDKVERYKPKIVCYVGKGVYENYTKRKNVSWGLQPESVVSGTLDFVAPSSSGLVRMKLEEIVDIYSKLRFLIEEH